MKKKYNDYQVYKLVKKYCEEEIKINKEKPSGILIGRSLGQIKMPEGSLVALIRRKGATLVPRGNTVLLEGDRLTIIGDVHGIEELNKKYN